MLPRTKQPWISHKPFKILHLMTYFCWLSRPHILFSELILCTQQQKTRWSKDISCMEVICITRLRTHTPTQPNLQEKWLLLSVAQSLFASSFQRLLSSLVTEKEPYSNDHLSHSLSSHRGHLSWFHIPEHLPALTPPSKGQSQLAHAALQSSAAPVCRSSRSQRHHSSSLRSAPLRAQQVLS